MEFVGISCALLKLFAYSCTLFTKRSIMPRMETHTKTKSTPRRIRGLTIAEYHRLRRLIAAGEIEGWGAAQAAGLCLPHRRRGRKRKPLGVPTLEGSTVCVQSTPRGSVASATTRSRKTKTKSRRRK